MNDISEENRETYVLTYNKFNTYKVFIFSDLNKAKIHKMSHTNAPIHEIEILLSFKYLNVLKSTGDLDFFHFKKLNTKHFLFEIDNGDRKKNIFVAEKIYAFETNGIMTRQFPLLSFCYDGGIIQYENDIDTSNKNL